MKNEIRSYNVKETRAELLEKDGKRYLVGKIPYDSLSQDLGGFREKINRGAFNKTLADKADVKALVNHDHAKILGRVKNDTLNIEDREDGLYCTVELGNQSYANDLWESVQRDDVSTLSFGFNVIKDSWNNESGKTSIRILHEVRLLEISFGVVFPAYTETEAEAVFRGLYQEAGFDFDLINGGIVKIISKSVISDEERAALKAVVDYIDEAPVKNDKPQQLRTVDILDKELRLLEEKL